MMAAPVGHERSAVGNLEDRMRRCAADVFLRVRLGGSGGLGGLGGVRWAADGVRGAGLVVSSCERNAGSGGVACDDVE